jgi:adenylate kinase family enzyme
MKRVAVVGTTGSGKSTLAERLAALLGGSFVDLDALNWGPNWTPTPIPLFRERVAATLSSERWAVAGNYSALRDIVWGQADTLVWLDYPLSLILWRLLRRTIRRVATREELWGGNREHFWVQFGSSDSLFYYAVTTHRRRRRQFSAALAMPEYLHLHVMRFRRPGEAEAWLSRLGLSESTQT